MNEDDGNNRRMLLAAAICLAVLAIWPVIFPPAVPPPGSQGDPSATSTSTPSFSTLDGAEVAAGSVTTSSVGAGEAVSPTPRVEAQIFSYEGEAEIDDEMVAFRGALTNVGGAFERFVLPGFNERDADNRPTDQPIQLADPVSKSALEELAFHQMGGIAFVGGSTFELPVGAVYEVVSSSDDTVVYRYRDRSGVEVERTYAVSSDRTWADFTIKVTNRSDRAHTHQLELGAALEANDAMRSGGGWSFAPPPDHLEAACHVDGSMERENVNSLDDGEPERFAGGVEWVGVDRQYFLSAIVARDADRAQASCVLEGRGDVARASMVLPPVALEPGQSRTHRFTAYMGPKVPEALDHVSPELRRAINYTVLGLNLAPLCNLLLWILGFIHDLTGSWGLAIIGLTVLVKAILFPLNQKQGKSMRAMSALKPEMEKIKTKYPDDQQRQSQEMMRLYKEHNVNPAGGCLPLLLQMPIWFALYRSLWVSVDLYQESFLWIPDLTTRDPYWILPVILVVVMFIQQKMMPAAMDPAQQKIMLYTMPLMFGFLMAALPAGLCFYILVNTLLTIVQQHLINRTVGPPVGGPKAAVQGA